MRQQGIVAHERRIIRRLEARGEAGLGEALVRLDGSVVGRRFRIETLYAVGSEGAVYLARDIEDPSAPMRVAKVALLPLHRPFDLTDEELRRRRDCLREEATNLARSDSRYMPASFGLFHFANPALESEWGGEFAEPEPCIVMEKIPGFDLDLWLARMHSSRVPKVLLRRQLDHVAVVVLSGLMDLQDKGFFYTDLRPGNVRIRGRSRERVRLLDAGSLVRVDDLSGKFPHVPAYLPPELFDTSHAGGLLLPNPAIQAVMAGRTLFEVATGRVPLPGEPVETAALYGLNVSPSVAETIERLCRASFPDVATALAYLSENFRHDAADRPPATPSPSRAAAQAAAREASQSAARESMRSDAPAARVPEPPPVTFSLPPAKPRLDLHSMLASARSTPAPAKSAARPGDRPASLIGVRPMAQEDEATPAVPRAPSASPARSVAPAPAPVRAAAQVPAPAAAAAPARPAPVRPVQPPVRPARLAPAVVRVDEPVDYEFAAQYAAARAKGETPRPVTPATPAARPARDAASEPITLEATGVAPASAPRATVSAPGTPQLAPNRPEPTRADVPRADVPIPDFPRPVTQRIAAQRVDVPPPATPRTDVSPPDVSRPVARPAPAPQSVTTAPPPPPTAVPLAQAFAMAPKPSVGAPPVVPEAVPAAISDEIPVLHPGRVTQTGFSESNPGRLEFAEPDPDGGFAEPRPRRPTPRPSKAAAPRSAPPPAPSTADVPVLEPVSKEVRSRELTADVTADEDPPVLPAPRARSFFARLVDRLLGRR